MKSMRLSEVNKHVMNRSDIREMNEHQPKGFLHNAGIKTNILQQVGSEMKMNPPKILAKTKKKFGIARMKKQKTAILLNKAREAGAHIKMKGR